MDGHPWIVQDGLGILGHSCLDILGMSSVYRIWLLGLPRIVLASGGICLCNLDIRSELGIVHGSTGLPWQINQAFIIQLLKEPTALHLPLLNYVRISDFLLQLWYSYWDPQLYQFFLLKNHIQTLAGWLSGGKGRCKCGVSRKEVLQLVYRDRCGNYSHP